MTVPQGQLMVQDFFHYPSFQHSNVNVNPMALDLELTKTYVCGGESVGVDLHSCFYMIPLSATVNVTKAPLTVDIGVQLGSFLYSLLYSLIKIHVHELFWRLLIIALRYPYCSTYIRSPNPPQAPIRPQAHTFSPKP